MPAKQQYEPYTIEVTRQLDLSEADEKAVARFRENAFGDEDAIVQSVIGPTLTAAERIILWARWRQFVQRIVVFSQSESARGGGDSPVRTEEITRRYRIQPQ